MAETRLIIRQNLPDGGQSGVDVGQAFDIAAGRLLEQPVIVARRYLQHRSSHPRHSVNVTSLVPALPERPVVGDDEALRWANGLVPEGQADSSQARSAE